MSKNCEECINEVSCVELLPNGKTRVKINNALACMYQCTLPEGNISEILDELEQTVRQAASSKGFPAPDANAFSNVRGAWFEIILAACAWEFARQQRSRLDLGIVKMPNIRVFDFTKLLIPETQQLLKDLETSLLSQNEPVRLVTSNPDLLFIVGRGFASDERFEKPINNLSVENITHLMNSYIHLEGKCRYDSILAGLGLKTSLRPDRRLQLVHEGNILKSVFNHLRLRYWNPHHAFSYFGATTATIGPADLEALETAATHSILQVTSIPERAVDMLFSLKTTSDITEVMLPSLLETALERFEQ
mgnify:CR=1 FL=1